MASPTLNSDAKVRVIRQGRPAADREAGFDAGRCSLDTIQLLFQLCEAIADFAAIEIEIARAGASLPLAARQRLPQARRHVLQPLVSTCSFA